MADKIIQMQVRNEANTAWDNIYPVTKDNVPYAIATGSTNVYAATITPAPSSYVEGMAIAVKIPVDSTGVCTLNINNLGAKTIKKANGSDVTNLKAGGIYTLRYDGVNFILQGEGASGNATASDLLLGKTATTDAGEITGTMPNRGAVSQSLAINGTYTIPAGYHNGSGKVTQSITTKGAQTYTPTTTNQVIAAGQYLSGSQTILGDADLIPANIVSGKNIFNVAGSAITGGAKVKSVQTIGSSIGGTTTTNTHTISAVNVTKSVVILTAAQTNTSYYVNPSNSSLCASLSNSTTLKIERTSGANSVSYRAYVVEFETGVTIQQGLSTPTKYTYYNDYFYIPINSVDTSRSIILCSFRSGYDSTYRDARGYYFLEYNQINVTSVLGISAANYTNFLFSWYIITFN